ncbi:PaaI family thioesterase [Pseudomonas cavernae]|uniref:PaaI family thioesterase n=1 Tax=Pseudomonas cavernae TaxID=2320867 RepID=A0A385ZA56_9PSED|nr:PaaI family thioesterase [Pseudomonas cavernae]AYC34732.1 PaaI family thioesterase [Pseudomonas cavernae]
MSESTNPGSAFSRLLGLEVVSAAEGRAEVHMKMHEGLGNVHGKLHGGALFSLIDTAMGQACHSLSGGVAQSVTLESKINYIRPVSAGELVCRAWVLHAGKRTLVVEADTYQGEKLVAKAQATFAQV